MAPQSHASYFESCDISAKVVDLIKENQSYKLKINVLSYKIRESSHGESHCRGKVNKTIDIHLNELKRIPEVGKPIELLYVYYDGKSPNGVVFSEKWTAK